jgi:peptidoglycan/xylan/chitin deacetylase (PgdA/CDA1 family)
MSLFWLACNNPSRTTLANKPTVSFTFDDGITRDIENYKFEDWNQMILDALATENLKAVFFVTGSNKKNQKGKYLLNSWSSAGHQIANHTYTHPNFNNEKLSVEDFKSELLRTDSVITPFETYTKLFRFPYLKEGNTKEKIAGFRAVLQSNGYRNGHISIDASDWFVNNELIKSIRKDGPDSLKMEKYKAFYLQHILERANYYEGLAHDMTGRHIHHTLLLHHNLSSALFLGDLIDQFNEMGWELTDAEEAFKDEIFNQVPPTVPAGESIIWSLAKASGKYEDQLRYPAEDSRYEIPKLKAFGL